VELQVGEDGGDLERVGEIGITRGAGLMAMRLHRIDIGAVEQTLIRIRVIAGDSLDQFELTHHRLRAMASDESRPSPRGRMNLILARSETKAHAVFRRCRTAPRAKAAQ